SNTEPYTRASSRIAVRRRASCLAGRRWSGDTTTPGRGRGRETAKKSEAANPCAKFHGCRVEPVARRTLVNSERVTGIEPAFSAWEADVLPLNYPREERRRYQLPPVGSRVGSCRTRRSARS